MQSEQYLKERVNDQITWYNKNSGNNKFYYMTTKVVLTISAAIIPALTAYMDKDNIIIKIAIGVLSVLMAILVNINGIFRFKENWIQYRYMSELLQSEKQLYIAEAGKYKNNTEKDSLFVESIEGLLKNENSQWLETIKSGKETENK
ncbi:DUF4231 domain-containing protein [Flavobacterium taihuense]|uniref:DUF4231 domain-containing protein n=1 Tax=Flavobacterium taihuense TaxID=2857508 RepID=A0ABS6XZE3_9FLAO|nr:DUF4231 domain-containing protein [Flavobacterium taihuense]MBW4362050.1 DUF4231 domain-containing protein [Flavobacterium taihuense]